MADDYVEGIVANGEELWITDDQGALTKVLGLVQIAEPGFQVDEVEDTDHDSGGVKQYLAANGEWTTFQCTIKHRPGSPTHLLIMEHLLSKQYRPAEIVRRASNDGSTSKGTGDLRILNYAPPSRASGAKADATLTGRMRKLTNGAIVAPPAE